MTSTMTPTVIVHPDAETLAAAVAARLATRIVDAQATHGTASVVLTGGRIAEKIYIALRDSPVRAAIDWTEVDLWWGDERFLPAGDPERNETQARAALLDALGAGVPAHPMPASDGPDGADAEAAAARYAADLDPLPRFDVVLLGIGEDGHVASCFPDQTVGESAGPVAAVHDSPKPPPTRLTLTLPALNTGDEIWVIASGDGKAEAVAAALDGTGSVPAGRVHGRGRTLFLLDRAAATNLGPDLAPAAGTARS